MRDNSNIKFWERVARLYTPLQEKGNRELYQALCEKISPLFKKEQKVLELACGTGQLTLALADRAGCWTATDFSGNMVSEAGKRQSAGHVAYEVQDATALTYEDGVFDVVLIANALHIMPDPDKALEEIKRVLKPEGILIAPTFVYDGKVSKGRLWVMEKAGFKTFHKWKAKEYVVFLEDRGFQVKKKALIHGKMLPECVAVCQKKK